MQAPTSFHTPRRMEGNPPVCSEEKSHCPSIPAQKDEERDLPNSELGEKITLEDPIPRCHCNGQENVATIVPAR